MNRKGFTLVELLAVIVILSSISLIAVSSISTSLMKREDKEINEQKQLARNAAKIYFSLNEGKSCVKLSTLKSGDFFNDGSKTNKLATGSVIKYCKDKCCEVSGCKEEDKKYYAYFTSASAAGVTCY